MHTLLILSSEQKTYRSIIGSANLPDLKIISEPSDECDILLGDPSLIRDALASLPNLKWVQSIWAGVEPLMDSALKRDYILTNARGVFGQLMSEYVLTYLLSHERKVLHLHGLQRKKEWDDSNNGTLRGRTIGLLGVGSIGAEVARMAKFFGMTVRGYTHSREESADVDEYFHGDLLMEFASGLDYLINILPSTKATHGIINAGLLNALPDHALFINVGRGSAVDESALVEALTHNKIAGAVLDVFQQEPLPKDHPFWETPNLAITFHTAAPSLPEDIAGIFIENYKLYIEGKPLKHQVDFEKGY